MKRLETLREEVLKSNGLGDELFYLFFKAYGCDRYTTYEAYADAFYEAFSQLTPVISDGELIVGKRSGFSSVQQEEWNSTYKSMTETCSRNVGEGQASHMAIDYDLVLSSGLNGIIETVDGYMTSCSPEKLPFYKACKRCLQAVIRHAENYAAEAKRQAQLTEDSIRKEELLTIATICNRVPANPATSFYEAVQSVHFITHCISIDPFKFGHQQYQLGHPDRYLLPYYEADKQAGVITKEKAQLLLDCLGIQINNRVPNGLSSGYMVGGRDENGEIVANELTEMCMQVVDDIRLVYPAVGLCYTQGMPKHYLTKACDILSHGRSHPAIFNDDIITQGLKRYGVPERQAHNYIHSTCVEITPVASSNVWVASPYTNMPGLLLQVLDREYSSFEDLVNMFLQRLDQVIGENFELENNRRIYRREHSINPLLSCFVNDCLSRGTDIEQGGAIYNWTLPSFIGMANLVDAMYAIKTLVFDNKELTIAQLRDVLDTNFENDEELRLRILHTIPKYGNDVDEIDAYFQRFVDHIVAECQKYSGIYENGNLIPSVFCWIMHERMGHETGATPDGRKAGFPLGDGSGPCQGREMNGPTASILSSTKWEHTNLIGGVAVNMKFSKSAFGKHSLETMQTLIETYLERGGFEIQINVVDTETLKKAQKNPDDYRDLVVRIGGYSDYFVKLSPEMQEEVILRTEHEV